MLRAPSTSTSIGQPPWDTRLRNLQNSQHRAEQAIHQKLDAVADGLADFMEHLGGDQPGFAEDIDDLRRSVGIEKEMVDKRGPRTSD